jgi:organic radical activating enzyme
MLRHIGQWNVSPKLCTSGNQLLETQSPLALQTFAELPDAYFKFVIAVESGVDEVFTLRDQYDLAPQRILLMPEGRTLDALARKSAWLPELCVQHGLRFTTRLHIILWGDERGR